MLARRDWFQGALLHQHSTISFVQGNIGSRRCRCQEIDRSDFEEELEMSCAVYCWGYLQ